MEFKYLDEISKMDIKPKFRTGTIVRLHNHADMLVQGEYAVVEYSFKEMYPNNKHDFNEYYAVILLNSQSYPRFALSWVKESDLELFSTDYDYGYKLISYYYEHREN